MLRFSYKKFGGGKANSMLVNIKRCLSAEVIFNDKFIIVVSVYALRTSSYHTCGYAEEST